LADPAFAFDASGLAEALQRLAHEPASPDAAARVLADLPAALPQTGIGERAALRHLAGLVLGGAQNLDDPLAFAHMDPPTPWLAWAMHLWTARLNQNLLHPATAPVARDIESRVIAWLAPYFGMDGGHMTPGSTVANLTGLWVARDLARIETVVASADAHVSIAKAAKLLGLPLQLVETDPTGRLAGGDLGDLSRACLVLTAGTTSAGAIDPLGLAGSAGWTHVDAAWAGPLRLSPHHAKRLAGLEAADSIAVSGHKWLFQPKESGLILFRDSESAHAVLRFGGSYLAAPNIGLLGSHGANAVPLLALLMAWGETGLAQRLDRCMECAGRFGHFVESRSDLHLFAPPQTGIVAWRPVDGDTAALFARLPRGMASMTRIGGNAWLRCVAANPGLDIDAVLMHIAAALDGTAREA
jgi:L-2,4-diaminobutyrate decarboxylase